MSHTAVTPTKSGPAHLQVIVCTRATQKENHHRRRYMWLNDCPTHAFYGTTALSFRSSVVLYTAWRIPGGVPISSGDLDDGVKSSSEAMQLIPLDRCASQAWDY